jgi:hypothetical protein
VRPKKDLARRPPRYLKTDLMNAKIDLVKATETKDAAKS